MKKKIIFSTGGTGGHIFPAIHLMSHFFEKNYDTILVTDVRGDSFIKKNLKFKKRKTRSSFWNGWICIFPNFFNIKVI